MKRASAKRRTAKKKPGLTAKPIREPLALPSKGRTFVMDSATGRFRPARPEDYAGQRRPFRKLPPNKFQVFERDASGELRPAARLASTTIVYGVPLPPDLEEAVEHYAEDVFHFVYGELADAIQGSPEVASLIRGGLEAAFRDGFYLAVIHHSNDLKHVPEAVAIRTSLERGRKKGTEATKRKAEPRKKAIRQRFRELRRQGFTKEQADTVIAQDMRAKGERISEKTVYRARRGLR